LLAPGLSQLTCPVVETLTESSYDAIMQNVAIHKARELSSVARAVVEKELGRPLQEDEEVAIMAFAPHDAPSGENRRELVRRLEERINKTAERVRNVADEELEETIDEAVHHVRSHPE
jgi:L-lactate utilization protein LutC